MQNLNQGLLSKNLDIDTAEISKLDYNALLDYISSQGNGQKLLFSFKELISILQKNKKTNTDEISRLSTYPEEMKVLLSVLVERKLVSYGGEWSNDKQGFINFLQFSRSFEDFLKMQF